MFKKNNFLKFEILPDGKSLVTSNLNGDENTSKLAHLINEFLIRVELTNVLEGILKYHDKKGMKNVAIDFGREIIECQKNFEIKPVKIGRNPIIRPTQVIKQFSQSEE